MGWLLRICSTQWSPWSISPWAWHATCTFQTNQGNLIGCFIICRLPLYLHNNILESCWELDTVSTLQAEAGRSQCVLSGLVDDSHQFSKCKLIGITGTPAKHEYRGLAVLWHIHHVWTKSRERCWKSAGVPTLTMLQKRTTSARIGHTYRLMLSLKKCFHGHLLMWLLSTRGKMQIWSVCGCWLAKRNTIITLWRWRTLVGNNYTSFGGVQSLQ